MKGNYFTDKEHLYELEEKELIPIKYCDVNGKIDFKSNPNGSINNIAGILNENKNILGMMPHPERMADTLIIRRWFRSFFLSLLS